MDAHEMFYKMFDLFVEETSCGIQSINASKLCERIGK